MNNSNQVKNILFYGIGGQGVLTVAELCGLAAMIQGFHVKKSEVKGMAQRGGSVESYVRYGAKVHSPLPPEQSCDIIVCLSPSEYDRLNGQVKPGGADLFPYLAKADAAVGDKKLFTNTYMLGVLSAFLKDIDESSWMQAMERKFKRELEQNKMFFLKGRNEGMENDL
jgi:indolepyruvate ferredoxin oxidoreductase beta subunit